MTVNPSDSAIFGNLFGTAEMRALFADRQRLQYMLDVEAALARVQARLGIVPQDAAEAISAAASVDRLSLDEIATSTQIVGYPVVALVKALGTLAGPEAARYAHWGATTQDSIDPALRLQIRAGLDLVERVVATEIMGRIGGTLANSATDIILLMQTEIAEVFEPHQAGRGGSSTMPQKRNPIASEYIIAAARGVHALVPLMLGAMAQDHERATGPWQSEQLALPPILVLTSGALAHAATLAEGMVVDVPR